MNLRQLAPLYAATVVIVTIATGILWSTVERATIEKSWGIPGIRLPFYVPAATAVFVGIAVVFIVVSAIATILVRRNR